ELRLLHLEVVLGHFERHEDVEAVELDHAEIEDDVHWVGAVLRRAAEGGVAALEAHDGDGIPDAHPELLGEAAAHGDAAARIPLVPAAEAGAVAQERELADALLGETAHRH